MGIFTKFKTTLLVLVFSIASTNAGAQTVASFSQDKTQGCLPLVVQFTDNSNGNITSYAWDFGNGNTSTLKNPGAFYTQAGKYTVKLVVTDANGNKDSMVKYLGITAYANPTVGYSNNLNGGCEKTLIKFTDTSSGNGNSINSWLWNFGDGNTSTARNPQKTYDLAGTYAVSLMVTDANGCKSIANKPGLIKISKPATLDFSADKTGGCTLPLHINFSNNTKKSSPTGILYTWYFGNGDSSLLETPNTVSYSSFGNYTVKLTVKDANGCSQTKQVSNMVSIAPTKAQFSLSAKKGCTPLTVSFDNKSQGIASNANIKWIFGDGATDNNLNSSHTYTTPGKYSVKLVITSPDGCSDSLLKKDSIEVLASPVANFSYSFPNSCTAPDTIKFYDGSNPSVKWSWNFGDGSTDSVKNPVKIYKNPGIYTVSVTATDNKGCSATKELKDLVKIQTLKASYTSTQKEGCVPLNADYSSTSTSAFNIKFSRWDFGNGKMAYTPDASTTFDKEGTYIPRLMVTDSMGCRDTAYGDTVRVGHKTTPKFSAYPTSGCSNMMEVVSFTNTTDSGKGRAEKFFWSFGNGHYSAEYNPIDNYRIIPGTYTVTLVSWTNGCLDTLVKANYIHVKEPYAIMRINEDPCKDDTVSFENQSIGGHKFRWTINGDVYNTRDLKLMLPPGNYTVGLTVTDTVSGCWDSTHNSITLRKQMDPGFIHPDSICANSGAIFADTTQGSVSQTWDFGSAGSGSGKTYSHSFAYPGLYNVAMTVTDAYGCKITLSKTNDIKILGPDFKVKTTPDVACFPVQAQLVRNGSSQYGIKESYWQVMNDKIPALADITPYLFNQLISGMNNGLSVTLATTDTIGCTVYSNTSIVLSKPIARVQATPSLQCSYTAVNFNQDPATGMGINPTNFQWVINDTLAVNSGFNSLNYTFTKEGSYKTFLKVTDKLGCTDSITTNVAVALKHFNASFSVDNTTATCPPLVSTFTNTSNVQNTTIDKIEWAFGDGSSSSLVQPVKNYFIPGSFDISLKITDKDGCTDSITVSKQIKVGGPFGSFTANPMKGCVPFNVDFSAQINNAKYVRWDMGNGTLDTGINAKGTYTKAGIYTPSLILEDAKGCIVAYPGKDPVVAYETPKPEFTISGKCLYDNFTFTNITDTTTVKPSFNWQFGDNGNAIGSNASHRYAKTGQYTVTLSATSPEGCQSSKSSVVDIKDLKADFSVNKNNVCRNEVLNLADKTVNGNGISQYQWLLGDNRTETSKNPQFSYNAAGSFSISLIVKDAAGCVDSLMNAATVTVFDTLTPPTPIAHRVTVEQNNTVKLEFAPYILGDFGSYLIYRVDDMGAFQLYHTSTNKNDTVFVDVQVETGKKSYTYKIFNQTRCEKLSLAQESVAHTSILLTVKADTNRVGLNWSEYKGWKQVHCYSVFRKQNGESDYTKLVTVPATQTSYTDDSVFCGFTYQYFVMAMEACDMPNYSSSNVVSATPAHKATVKPAGIIRATVENDEAVLVEISASKGGKAPVVLYELQKSVDGISYTTINSTDVPAPFVDTKTDVHSQSYLYRVRVSDLCGDVNDNGNIGRNMVLHASMDKNDNAAAQWDAYEKWTEGIARYELELKNNNGGFDKVSTLTDTTYTDAQGLYNNLPNVCYRVKAVSNTGTISYSNTDCIKGKSSLFVPNAFTPNNDGTNNTFIIVGAYIKTFKMEIYNRQGEHLYTTHSLDESWDGTYKGQPVQEGAYVYVINAQGQDYKLHNVSGTVTVLR